MSKNNNFFGQPIFSQMVGLLNKSKIKVRAIENKSDHYCKRFSTFQHLITMIYGVTSGCNSLRELCGGIVSYGDKISHCKFDYSPKRSTISDANKRRDCIVFEERKPTRISKPIGMEIERVKGGLTFDFCKNKNRFIGLQGYVSLFLSFIGQQSF